MNPLCFIPLDPGKLNARQRENFHFQKISAVLADYGFQTLRLFDDWNGADFIAQHIDGEQFLLVQLKGRLTFDKKYLGRNLIIAFPTTDFWYLYPHDEMLEFALAASNIGNTESWERGLYTFPSIPKWIRPRLDAYRIPKDPAEQLP